MGRLSILARSWKYIFKEKTIIRHLPEYESISGVVPSPECQITQIDELNYQLNITKIPKVSPLDRYKSNSADSANGSPLIYSTNFGEEDLSLLII